MHDLNITLIQASPYWEDIPANLEYFEELLSDIAPTNLIILPEMFNTGFSTTPAPVAEAMSGDTISWMKEKSREKGAAICGSLIIVEKDRYYNRFIFMMPEGNFHYYDKRHLFSMGNEHLQFSRGEKRLVVNYNGWNILPQICYDLRFPAWSRNSWKDGHYAYDLLLYVASWPEARVQAWKSLLPARAIENLAYVAAVSRFGTDGNNIAHSGDSLVLDYLGNTLLSLPSHQESIRSVTLNKAALEEFRARFNVGPDWDRLEITK